MQKYIIGLDLGINNVGWSIIDEETNTIEKTGVRLYTASDEAKDRREARNTRRRMKRRKNRVEETLTLFNSIHFPSAITIDDSTGIRGFERLLMDNGYRSGLASEKDFLTKISAAVEGVKGSDCMIIARTQAIRREGLEGCIKRLVEAERLGAEMTLIIGINSLEQCKIISEKLPGWKMYPDVGVHDGVTDVELSDIEKLGFNLVTMHYLEKGALYGMLKYGKENFNNKNTVYSECHDMDGLIETPKYCEFMQLSQYRDWLTLESDFRNRAEEVMQEKEK